MYNLNRIDYTIFKFITSLIKSFFCDEVNLKIVFTEHFSLIKVEM